jgi:hypothetical protein
MSQVLELPHLVEHHRVPEVQVPGGRIEAGFDAKGLAPGELANEVFFQNELVDAAQDYRDFFRLSH